MMRHGHGLFDGTDEKVQNREKVLRRLLGELSPFRSSLAAAFALIVVSSLAQAVAPWLISRAIDHDLNARDAHALGMTMLALFATYVVAAFANRFQVRQIGIVGQRMLAGIRERLFGHLQRLPLGFFDRQPVGDLMSRLTNDVDTLNAVLSMGIPQVLGALFALGGILVAMLAMNWRLALISFTIIPVMLFTTSFLANRARTAYRETRKTTGAVMAEIEEEIVGVREAQAFNRTEANLARFRSRNAANRDANISAVGVTSAFAPSIDVLATLATTLVIGFGAHMVMNDQLTVGKLAAFLIYTQQFFRPVQLATQVYAQLQSALAGAERIYGILDEGTEAPDAAGALELGRVQGRITLRDVAFSYAADRPVLREVSLEVAAGQTVALVGPTGAGKTTLVNLLARFYDVSEGEVTLDGHSIQAVSRASLRAQIAMVPQTPFLFSGTIADNLAFGRSQASREEVEAAAIAVGAHEFISALPAGYDTPLGTGGGMLSQGQRQLLAFARAVLADRPILILDEATSYVDSRTETAIQTALDTLMAGRTSFVIAHRLSTIRKADLIVVVEDGRLIERGTHSELLALQGRYAQLHARQFAEPLAT